MIFRNILSVIISAVLASGFSFVLNSFTIFTAQYWYLGVIFFTVICFILNLVSSFRSAGDNFTQLLMAGIVIKLLLALVCIVIYMLWDKAGFFNFSIHYILHYILFTVFEIRYLLYIIKQKPPTQPSNKLT